MKNLTSLLLWGGAVAGAGAFGYKMIQKSRGKDVSPATEAIMYGGIGALAVGVATNVAITGKAPISAK